MISWTTRALAYHDGIGRNFRKDEAVEYCKARKALTTPKIEADVSPDYQPTSTEVDEAVTARRALKNLFRVGDPARLGNPLQTKSLSSFAFDSNSFFARADDG